MKSLKTIATLTLFALATVSFAAAQAEINPDHFPDPPAVPMKAEVQTQINNLQARVQGCEARMTAEQEKLEALRQEAISAGADGRWRRRFRELVPGGEGNGGRDTQDAGHGSIRGEQGHRIAGDGRRGRSRSQGRKECDPGPDEHQILMDGSYSTRF